MPAAALSHRLTHRGLHFSWVIAGLTFLTMLFMSAALPRNQVSAAGVPAYVIDPYGFVVLRYAPGFDPVDLRSDMAKLLKLM